MLRLSCHSEIYWAAPDSGWVSHIRSPVDDHHPRREGSTWIPVLIQNNLGLNPNSWSFLSRKQIINIRIYPHDMVMELWFIIYDSWSPLIIICYEYSWWLWVWLFWFMIQLILVIVVSACLPMDPFWIGPCKLLLRALVEWAECCSPDVLE